jgi:pimeloyl-ACP methyl ester carboxylesterase
MIRVIRQYYKTVSAVSPKLAASSAFELFKKVRKKKIKDQEKPFYQESRERKLVVNGDEIHSYEFGNPKNDLVILIHGWDSNVGCLYKFITPLLAKEKYIIGMNLPAHAFHKSSKTNLFEAKESFRILINSLPKDKKTSIISHSFGSAVVAYALSELDYKIDELVFLTSPNKINDIFLDYKRFIGLNDKAHQILVEKANVVLGENLETLTIGNKLQEVDFNRLHLFHDEMDKVLPYQNSLDIHKSVNNSTLYTFHKIGHYRMLWNDELVEKVMEVI